MTKREARRVAKVVAATALTQLVEAGGFWDTDHVAESEIAKIERACRDLSDDLYWQGVGTRGRGGPVVSLADAIKVTRP